LQLTGKILLKLNFNSSLLLEYGCKNTTVTIDHCLKLWIKLLAYLCLSAKKLNSINPNTPSRPAPSIGWSRPFEVPSYTK